MCEGAIKVQLTQIRKMRYIKGLLNITPKTFFVEYLDVMQMQTGFSQNT